MYLAVLERLMIIEDQPAWTPHLRSRARLRRGPKRHFADPSLAVAALGATPDRLLEDLELFGFLFESLVVRDLRVYAQAADAEVLQYRDSTGLEVDAIVQARDGRWAAFEIKLGAGRVDDAARNLLKFAARVDPGASPHAGGPGGHRARRVRLRPRRRHRRHPARRARALNCARGYPDGITVQIQDVSYCGCVLCCGDDAHLPAESNQLVHRSGITSYSCAMKGTAGSRHAGVSGLLPLPGHQRRRFQRLLFVGAPGAEQVRHAVIAFVTGVLEQVVELMGRIPPRHRDGQRVRPRERHGILDRELIVDRVPVAHRETLHQPQRAARGRGAPSEWTCDGW